MSRVAVQLAVPDEQTMHELERNAEKAGFVVVTDGKVIQLAWPHAIPPGFQRFAFVDKNAHRPLDPKETRS